MLGSRLRECLRQDYLEMLKSVEGKYSDSLTGFAPLVGSGYENSQSRLLVCGRAVNGWRNCLNPSTLNDNVLDDIYRIPEVDIKAGCEMNWIVRSRTKWKSKGGKDGYNYKKSPFWHGTFDVFEKLEGTNVNVENKICWSNVYKLSPEKGNPGHSLRKLQIDSCARVLRKEIEILNPRHILFVTGGWGKVVLESLGISTTYNSKEIVQYAGNGHGAKIVVANRPEGRKRRDWSSAVLNGFNTA